jgi:hypothetical protein
MEGKGVPRAEGEKARCSGCFFPYGVASRARLGADRSEWELRWPVSYSTRVRPSFPWIARSGAGEFRWPVSYTAPAYGESTARPALGSPVRAISLLRAAADKTWQLRPFGQFQQRDVLGVGRRIPELKSVVLCPSDRHHTVIKRTRVTSHCCTTQAGPLEVRLPSTMLCCRWPSGWTPQPCCHWCCWPLLCMQACESPARRHAC